MLLDFLETEDAFQKPIKYSEEEARKEEDRFPMRFKKMIDISENPLTEIILKYLDSQVKKMGEEKNNSS